MELFGVQEIPNTTKSNIAPGWAYVADTGPNLAANQQPKGRKRAARTLGGGAGDFTAKQDAKVLRELAALDRDGGAGRDVSIPVPVRARDGAGRVSHGKVTPNVRKILQSQKTFANHLSDAEALAALAASNPTSQPSAQQASNPTIATKSGLAGGAATPKSSASVQPVAKRSHKKKDPSTTTATPLRRVSTATSTSTPIKSDPDTVMTDAPSSTSPILKPLPPNLELKTHPADNDPLLKSRIPNVPDDEELRRLIAEPPLTYLEARGSLQDVDMARPVRTFCEICGYWGRVKCLKCGSRVCALECLRTHQEECYTRYGA